ncbi:hypothetical protein [Streptomyces fructofermentans]|uniref:Uncharacterized protein n=1 Tax=Streptomyces fructofermentans TaxID=152141 RepID=A0A918K453_9ACTN|nr:hypothetical protein [Streptomyces fructofermentans]GGX43246.1 hypothetical protein GCM10010515_07590 [Streptomyces fructofermentans]
MSTRTDEVERYEHLWQEPAYPHRWVLWDTAGDVLVFDRETNCLVDFDDESVLPDVLGRMRAAGVPESGDYPGRPCA